MTIIISHNSFKRHTSFKDKTWISKLLCSFPCDIHDILALLNETVVFLQLLHECLSMMHLTYISTGTTNNIILIRKLVHQCKTVTLKRASIMCVFKWHLLSMYTSRIIKDTKDEWINEFILKVELRTCFPSFHYKLNTFILRFNKVNLLFKREWIQLFFGG